jgi:phosphoribosylglycinamide formyltransferase-1
MIVVFASGAGSNFEAIAQAFPAQKKLLICNIEKAGVIEISKKLNIDFKVIPHKNFSSRAEHEKAIWKILHTIPNILVIALAGYMRILSTTFFEELKNYPTNLSIINLHPAPLDLYQGAHGYEFAIENKMPCWGLSIHETIPKLDAGRLLNYTEFPVFPFETIVELKNRVRSLEHQLYTETLKNIISNRKVNYDSSYSV